MRQPLIPLCIHGKSCGTIVFYWRAGHKCTDREVRTASALGNLAASAFGTAELYGAQLRLRADAETSGQRARFLAQSGLVLASSLEYEQTLAAVAKLSVPSFADWAGVDVVEDGMLKRVSVAHTDPAKVRIARELHERYPPRETDAARTALREGRSILIADIPDDLLVQACRDTEHLRLIRDLGLRSCIIVPMMAGGTRAGIIMFVTAESGRIYTAADLETAEELARRAATAVDHAKLYRDVRLREQRYRSLVDATSSVVWTVDADGGVVDPQPLWTMFTGQEWPDYQGFGWTAAVHPEDRDFIGQEWAGSRAAQRAYLSECRLWHAATGEYRHIVARAVPVPASDGTTREWMGQSPTSMTAKKRRMTGRGF